MPLISVSLVCCIYGRYSCHFCSPSHNCASKGENEQFRILRYQGVVLLFASYFLRFTLYNTQPHGFCNHLKTKTVVLGIQDLLQRKRVEIC